MTDVAPDAANGDPEEGEPEFIEIDEIDPQSEVETIPDPAETGAEADALADQGLDQKAEEEAPPVEGRPLTAEEAEARNAEEAPPLQTECAFVCYINPQDGHWVADVNTERPILQARVATMNDFFHAAATIDKDIRAMEGAQRTVQMQQQLAMQMAQQAQAQAATAQIAREVGGPVGAGLTGGLDLSKLRQPGA